MTAEALMRAILEAPEDDAPRLVFADWLEEHGESERAEFTRVQIDLARLPFDDSRRWGLAAREEVLLKKYSEIWARALHQRPCRFIHYEYQRGFVARISLDAVDFLGHADDIFRLQPIVGVHLSFLRDHFDQVMQSQYLCRLRELDLEWNIIGDEDAATLAKCSSLSSLKILNLRHNFIGDAGVQAFVSSPYFSGLAFLNLEKNPVGPAGMAFIANSKHVGQLEKLWVGDIESYEEPVRVET